MKTPKFLLLFAVTALMAFVSCSGDDDDDSSSSKKEYTDIYFMDTYNEDIEVMPIAGGTTTALTSNVYGVGIAYDKENEQIYYSDFADDSTPNGKIVKMDIDGSNTTTIVTGIYDPYAVALNVDAGKVYWCDGDGNVSRSNLDGSSAEVLVNIADGAIRAIALDLTNDKLYFMNVNNNDLYKADLDGSNAEVILNGYYGYAICIDEVNSKIYFDAQTDDESISGLFRANLDGSDPVEIDDTQSRIYGIAIDTENSLIYWSARDTYEIYSANLNGTGKTTLASDLGSPRGIFLKY